MGKIRPSKGKIDTLITSSKNRQLMEVSSVKEKSYYTLQNNRNFFENNNTPTVSLLECTLETGRTHQIRVHMKSKGCPIVGDKVYSTD